MMNNTSASAGDARQQEAVAARGPSVSTNQGALRHYDWMTYHAAHRPRSEAIRDLGTNRRFTYADLDARAEAMAAYLASIGIGRGDRVAVLAHSGVEYFDIQFACGRTGAICVLLNWRLTIAELEYVLKDSTPALLVHDVNFRETAEALVSRCGIASTLQINSSSQGSTYERAIAGSQGTPVDRAALTHDDVVCIMYTSGTTGRPKGAMITHGMVFWNCVNFGIPVGVGPDSVHLNVLPLFHTGGLNCYCNPVLHAGGTVVIHGTPGQRQGTATRYSLWPIGGPSGLEALRSTAAHCARVDALTSVESADQWQASWDLCPDGRREGKSAALTPPRAERSVVEPIVNSHRGFESSSGN